MFSVLEGKFNRPYQIVLLIFLVRKTSRTFAARKMKQKAAKFCQKNVICTKLTPLTELYQVVENKLNHSS